MSAVPAFGRATFGGLGCLVVVATTDPAALPVAAAAVTAELAAVDLAASRFRPDSDLCRANAGAGTPVAVSPRLVAAVQGALRAARLTGGAVDPTLGAALAALGYDRDFAAVPATGPCPARVRVLPAAWREVEVDPLAGTVTVPAGVALDLGATAKAQAADLAAAHAAQAAAPAGVLVSVGGDIAVAGPPPGGGWPVRVGMSSWSDPAAEVGPVVTLRGGGLATSGTGVRRWVRGGVGLHHILDPATGQPVRSRWVLATVAAGTAVDANIAATAAIVRGEAGATDLARWGLPARLVDRDGTVLALGGWPGEDTGRAA